KGALSQLDERDEIAARRPYGSRIACSLVPKANSLGRPAAGRHDVDLRASAAVGLKTYPASVGRVAWRGIDGGGVGKPRRGLGTQIHHEQVRIDALLQAHDHTLTIGR